ncbi:MAG TPA: glycoside hydrolase, partial [Terriglobales bacterium]|nr:glycoside hydrolase [Terriglobales bacterium]
RKEPGVPVSVGDQIRSNPDVAKQRGVIYTVAPSFHTAQIIWAGTDDGLIWITRDGGANWTDITPPAVTSWSKISQISVSHFDDLSAYVAVNRFRIDDMQPHIFRTHNGGKTWQEISGLPENSPVNTVREDPVRKGLLFAGTEASIWVSLDDGGHWQSLQLNLPHTSMRDLWIHDDDVILATHGRSFWILDDIAPLREVNSEIEASGVHLFTPAPAIRIRRDTNTDTPLPADEPAGENPPDGAVLDYYLSKPGSGPAVLEIRDAQGKLVRRYSSDDKPEQTQAELEKQLIPLYWLKPEQVLSAEPGMHRWIWDLRYAPPTSTLHEYPISAVPHRTPRYPLGPLVLPGKYTIRLTANGKTQTEEITVKMDPRIKTATAGLSAQFDLAMQLATDVSRSSQAVSQARSVQEQLIKLSKTQESPNADSAKKLAQHVTAILEGADKNSDAPTLKTANQNAIDLYKDVEKSDAAPTVSQRNATAIVARQVSRTTGEWESFKGKELSGFNRQLHSSGEPEIRLDLPPRQQETGENEE